VHAERPIYTFSLASDKPSVHLHEIVETLTYASLKEELFRLRVSKLPLEQQLLAYTEANRESLQMLCPGRPAEKPTTPPPAMALALSTLLHRLMLAHRLNTTRVMDSLSMKDSQHNELRENMRKFKKLLWANDYKNAKKQHPQEYSNFAEQVQAKAGAETRVRSKHLITADSSNAAGEGQAGHSIIYWKSVTGADPRGNMCVIA